MIVELGAMMVLEGAAAATAAPDIAPAPNRVNGFSADAAGAGGGGGGDSWGWTNNYVSGLPAFVYN